MPVLYHNITGSTGVNVELLAANSAVGSLRSISITNVHVSATGTLDLFLQSVVQEGVALDKVTYYLVKNVSIPSGSTLLIDNIPMLSFDNSRFALNATVGSSDTLDIIINA